MISPKAAATGTSKPEGWDWLALVRINLDGSRQFFLLPHDVALALSKPAPDGQRGLKFSSSNLAAYENNFTLQQIVAAPPPKLERK
jgi:hypothetical protein